MNEVLIAIVTSLAASIIFWIVFSFLPDRRRHNKVRPIVEFNIYEIFIDLGFYIGIALKINEYGWSFPRDNIDSGQATKQDFDLWLQNKCLNETYKFDEMGDKLLPVGKDLSTYANKIYKKTEKCSTYYPFMTADEILLLRKINSKLFVYSYDDHAPSKLGRATFYPLVPNISYMAENFYELSKFYIELQSIIWSYKKIDKSINKYIIGDFKYNEACKCYNTGDFNGCIHHLKKSTIIGRSSKLDLLFRAYYALGNIPKAISILKNYFEVTQNNHSLLIHLFDDKFINFDSIDDTIWNLIAQNCSSIEIIEAMESAEKSKIIQEQGIRTCKLIKSFYTQKLEENSRKATEQVIAKRKRTEIPFRENSK